MKPACPQLDAARASGAPRYFTGNACKHGHVAERITNNGTCVECRKRHSVDSSERRKEQIAAWFREHRDEQRQKTNARRAANRPLHREKNRAWAENNPEKVAESRAAWIKAHPSHINAYRHRRRADSRKAMPAWADKRLIKMVYQQARDESVRAGERMHVDHIVPMRSRLVCGLHNEFNLQLLPASANQSKGNRWWPDMPEANDGQ
jgi:hypothetical protein